MKVYTGQLYLMGHLIKAILYIHARGYIIGMKITAGASEASVGEVSKKSPQLPDFMIPKT